NVAGSPITSIEPLQNMPELKDLNISSTFVEDLRPLKNLNKLSHLNISNTSIRSLEGLQNSQLTVFHATDTHIDSLNAIKGQPLRIVSASNTRIEAIEPICSAKLKSLVINNSPYLNLFGLELCTKLEELRISTTNTKNLELLTSSKIHTLDISHNKIKDISKLGSLLKLQHLNISFNPIQDLSALVTAKNLREILAVRIQVKDLEPLTKLDLKVLKIYQCWSIKTLEPLAKMKTLEKLYVPAYRRDYEVLKDLKLKSLSDKWHDMDPATFWKRIRSKD
ncbi:MAG: leucine-rich repeat domain-containing protein, partial [Lentisphaeraceae bacterium]|nr:leucine-rich repeat domain-containing protein [Lentisphaeraceae bacterium]